MAPFELKAIKFKPATKKKYDMIAEGLPRPTSGGFSLTYLAKRRSGKTNLFCNMLLNGGFAKAFDLIIIMSPTVHLDRTFTSLEKLKNVMCTDDISNEMLAKILARQKATYLSDPDNSSLLLCLDDCGNFLKAKEARKMVDIFYSTARQYNCSICCSVQSVTMLTSCQLSNTQYWCIWDLDGRALKKIAQELCCHLTPKEFEIMLKKATHEKYSFLYINTEAENDSDVFKKNFTQEIE